MAENESGASASTSRASPPRNSLRSNHTSSPAARRESQMRRAAPGSGQLRATRTRAGCAAVGAGKSKGAAIAHLRYIDRNGELNVETDSGHILKGREVAGDLAADRGERPALRVPRTGRLRVSSLVGFAPKNQRIPPHTSDCLPNSVRPIFRWVALAGERRR